MRMSERIILALGTVLVLMGILTFGGRTPTTLAFLTATLWLANGASLTLIVIEKWHSRQIHSGEDYRRKDHRLPACGTSSPRSPLHRLFRIVPCHFPLPSHRTDSPSTVDRPLAFRPSPLSLLTLFCWGAFILLQWIGFQNPSYQPTSRELSASLYVLDASPWLPTTASVYRGKSFLWLWSGILLWTFLSACTVRNRDNIARHLFGLFLGFSIIAAIGAFVRLSGSDKILWIFESHTSYFFATIFYKNHWGSLAVLMTGLGIGLTFRLWRKERGNGHFPDQTVSFGCLVFVIALTIPLANARGATLALIGLVIALAFSLITQQRRKKLGWKPLSITVVSLVAGISLLAYLNRDALETGIERTERQLNEYTQEQEKYPELRGYLWEDALKAFADRPWTGWGIGSYVHIQTIYAGEKLRSLGNGQQPPLVEFAHNDWIQFLVEFGVIGTLLLILPPLAAVFVAFRQGTPGRLAKWMGACLLALLFTAFLDFPFGNPVICLTVGWIAALAFGDAMGTRRR